MKEEQNQFLRLLGEILARLAAEQAGWVLNCQPHDVAILVAARFLEPLGKSNNAAIDCGGLNFAKLWLRFGR